MPEISAIVLDGNENQAVAATRSLARAGYEVVVGASEAWSKAGWSRGCARAFKYPSPRNDAVGFVARIVEEVARAGQPAVVLPMTEGTTLPLSAHRGIVESAGGRMALPSHEAVLTAFDKQQTTMLAARLGVTVPHTRRISTVEEAHEVAAEVPLPAVLKPHSSEELVADGSVRSTGGPLYANSRADVITAASKLLRRSRAVLIQEFIEGSGAGYFGVLSHGRLRGDFAHRRLRDLRPTGSGSVLRESTTPDPRMRDAAMRILGALAWHGVAMVEFRVRSDGTPVFIEVNGRFWNSLALAVYAGVDFPVAMARLAIAGDLAPLPAGRAGVRCRWLLGDARHLVAVWRGAPSGYVGRFPGRIETTLEVLRPVRHTHHDNFVLRDPAPELGDWLHFLLRRAPRALRARVAAADA